MRDPELVARAQRTATRLQRGQVSVQQGRLTEPVPEGTGNIRVRCISTHRPPPTGGARRRIRRGTSPPRWRAGRRGNFPVSCPSSSPRGRLVLTSRRPAH